MSFKRSSKLLVAGIALCGAMVVEAAKPVISPHDVDAFLERCAYLDIPFDAREQMQGVSIRGLKPARYFSADSGEGSGWGFEFDISLAEIKRQAPDLVQRVDMPIPRDWRESTTAFYRMLEEPFSPSDPVRLMCFAESIGEENP